MGKGSEGRYVCSRQGCRQVVPQNLWSLLRRSCFLTSHKSYLYCNVLDTLIHFSLIYEIYRSREESERERGSFHTTHVISPLFSYRTNSRFFHILPFHQFIFDFTQFSFINRIIHTSLTWRGDFNVYKFFSTLLRICSMWQISFYKNYNYKLFDHIVRFGCMEY